MKKKIGLGLLIGLVFLTGCVNSVQTKVCVKETNEYEGMKSLDTVTIKYNKSSVLSVKGVTVTDANKDYATMAYNLIEPTTKKFSEIEGIQMSITKENDTKLTVETSVDFEKVDIAKAKEILGDSYNETTDKFYNAKNITVDQFVENNFKGYDCK